MSNALLDLIVENGLENEPYEDIARELNAPSVQPNPMTEPPSVPAPLPSTNDLFVIVAADPETLAADMQAIQSAIGLIKLGEAIAQHSGIPHSGDIHTLIGFAQQQGLSESTIVRINERLDQQVPDPGWMAEIPGPSLAQSAGFGRVSPEQVQQAMIGFGGAG